MRERRIPLIFSLFLAAACGGGAKTTPPTSVPTPPVTTTNRPPTDTFPTSAGDLTVTPIKHATVLFGFGGKNIYVDPWSEGSYTGLPKADLVLITDIHPDHLDTKALDIVTTPSTPIVAPPAVVEKLPRAKKLANGETTEMLGIRIEAIPMYNLQRGPEPGKLFHDKGRGDGFVLTFGDKRVYLSGDTECIDEMKALKNIDIAFVCMNLPYTMPPSEAATCVNAFKPKVVFPYHYRDSNLDEFTSAIGAGIEVRKRDWYPSTTPTP